MPVSNTGIKNQYIRMYDGGSPIRKYVEFFQLDPPTLPLIESRPTTGITLDSGRATDYMTTFVEDESVPFMPVEGTFRLMHMSESLELINMGNWRQLPTWQIGGVTWVGMQPNTIGTRKNSDNASIACVVPQDVPQQTRMVEIVMGHTVPTDAPAGTGLFISWKGVVVSAAQVVPEPPQTYVELTVQIWGAINPNLPGWPAGQQCFPS